MKMPPSSTSSSPASIRKAVDLPEPEGPTSTSSSPSRSLRSSAPPPGAVALAKMRVARSKRTSATVEEPPICHDDFAPESCLRFRGSAEIVQREQRRARDRWRVRDHYVRMGRDVGALRGRPLEKPLRAASDQATAQHDFEFLFAKPQPLDCGGRERA